MQRNVSAVDAAASKKIKNVFEEHANPGKSKGTSPTSADADKSLVQVLMLLCVCTVQVGSAAGSRHPAKAMRRPAPVSTDIRYHIACNCSWK
jgi:hypothetical protein